MRSRKLALAFWCSLVLACGLASVPVQANALTIRAIAVEGNAAMSAAAITNIIQSRVGSAYSRSVVQDDIRRLFRRGEFSDIRVSKVALGSGIKLIFRVVERPLITKITFTGNKKLKEKALLEKIPVRAHRTLRGEELAKSVAAIKKAYEEKRYYLVDVDYTLSPVEGGSVLTFQIKEHGKAAIRRIQFVGNRIYPDKKLKSILRTKEKGAFFLRTGKFLRDRLEQDVAMLARHYLQNGYLRIQIDRPRIEISKDKRNLFLTFALSEGQRFLVSDVSIDGDILTTREEIESVLKMKAGETYNHEIVEQDLETLRNVYGSLGYAFANIQPIPIPDDSTGTAKLIYGISKGRRVYIDRINITGNSTTRDKVIRRELQVKEGDLFNRQLLTDSREKLQQLGYFEDIVFSTPRGRRPDSVNLNIAVTEKPTGTFNIGAGYSTAESVFFTGSIAKQNFFGRGLSGQIAAEVSKLRQQYVVQMTDPYFLDSEWILGASSYRTVYRYPEFDRKALGGSLTLGHRIFDHASVSAGYTFEDVEASNFFVSVPQVFQNSASGKTSSASLTLAYDTRDNRIFPNKGFHISMTNEFSGSYLGGNNNFYRLNGFARYYQPLIWGFISKIYFKGGYIRSLEGDAVPLFDRYLLGGPNSLRGYNIWSVGPSIRIPSSTTGGDSDFIFGGNKMTQINAELEVPLYTPAGFKAVAFFDMGNSFPEEDNVSFKKLRMNYGFGLRWVSPLGPLRFEWGIPIKKRAGESGVVFNFSIGDFF